MTAILLTQDNLKILKSGLRPVFPDIGSAHLSEALAVALGFRTHAALLTKVAGASSDFPHLGRLDMDALCFSLESLGHTRAPMEPVDLRDGIDLPQPIWLAFPGRDLKANNQWFEVCRRRNIPNVCIETRARYCRLNWDCISTDHRYDRHVKGPDSPDLGRALFARFQAEARAGPGKPDFFGSAFVGHIDGLLPKTARILADAVFEMLYTPMLDPARQVREPHMAQA